MSTQRKLPRDPNGSTIMAGEGIDSVVNVALTSGAYASVAVPAGAACKGFVAKTRSGQGWYLATAASPTTYYSVTSTLAMDLVADAAEVLFYAKSINATDTLEIILVN